jgi:hypothetical protein
VVALFAPLKEMVAPLPSAEARNNTQGKCLARPSARGSETCRLIGRDSAYCCREGCAGRASEYVGGGWHCCYRILATERDTNPPTKAVLLRVIVQVAEPGAVTVADAQERLLTAGITEIVPPAPDPAIGIPGGVEAETPVICTGTDVPIAPRAI